LSLHQENSTQHQPNMIYLLTQGIELHWAFVRCP